jgi:hypothetical protein
MLGDEASIAEIAHRIEDDREIDEGTIYVGLRG